MRVLPELFENNRAWAAEMRRQDPEFFERLARQQSPDFLWIGCSDSRVPANQIAGLLPGDMFVQRNVANIVSDSDLNCMAVMQFAIESLHVKHIIICGHYGCGGVLAALRGETRGLIGNWLAPLRYIRNHYRAELEALPTEGEQHARLCELNVIEQVRNAASTDLVHAAWRRGDELAVHGWIYDIRDGLLKDLGVLVTHS